MPGAHTHVAVPCISPTPITTVTLSVTHQLMIMPPALILCNDGLVGSTLCGVDLNLTLDVIMPLMFMEGIGSEADHEPVSSEDFGDDSGAGEGPGMGGTTLRHGTAWHDMVWHGTAWHGIAWHGMAWLIAWHGLSWHGMSYRSMVQHSMACHIDAWCSIAWHIEAWCSIAWHIEAWLAWHIVFL